MQQHAEKIEQCAFAWTPQAGKGSPEKCKAHADICKKGSYGIAGEFFFVCFFFNLVLYLFFFQSFFFISGYL